MGLIVAPNDFRFRNSGEPALYLGGLILGEGVLGFRG